MLASLAIADNAFAGGEEVRGFLRNIDARSLPAIGASLSFDHLGVNALSSGLRVAVGVNGKLEAILSDGEEQTGVSILQDGYNTLDFAILAPGETAPSFYGDPYGRRAYLRWSPVEGAASYNLYWSSNGVSYSLYDTTTDTQFSSEVLPEGTNFFKLSSLDEVGNESALSSAKAVAIPYRSEPVTNPSIAWNGSALALSWSLPSDPDRTGVNLYANFNLATERLETAIREDVPFVSLGNVTSYTFTPSEEGLWHFYVRPQDVDGRHSDDVRMLTANTVMVASNLNLLDPEQVSLIPVPGGKVKLSWRYNWPAGEDCRAFYFYQANSLSAIQSNLESDTPYSGFPFMNVTSDIRSVPYSQTFDQVFTANVWFSVRSATSNGAIKSTLGTIVSCTPDSTAPATPSFLLGIGN